MFDDDIVIKKTGKRIPLDGDSEAHRCPNSEWKRNRCYVNCKNCNNEIFFDAEAKSKFIPIRCCDRKPPRV